MAGACSSPRGGSRTAAPATSCSSSWGSSSASSSTRACSGCSTRRPCVTPCSAAQRTAAVTRVSVGLPVYNGETATSRRALSTLVAQTHEGSRDHHQRQRVDRRRRRRSARRTPPVTTAHPLHPSAAQPRGLLQPQRSSPSERRRPTSAGTRPTTGWTRSASRSARRVLDENPDVVLAWPPTPCRRRRQRRRRVSGGPPWDDSTPSTRLRSLLGPPRESQPDQLVLPDLRAWHADRLSSSAYPWARSTARTTWFSSASPSRDTGGSSPRDSSTVGDTQATPPAGAAASRWPGGWTPSDSGQVDARDQALPRVRPSGPTGRPRLARDVGGAAWRSSLGGRPPTATGG